VRRLVGGRQVMRAQLDRLREAASRPNITIQVIPFDAGSHPGMDGSFIVLEFPDPADQSIVYTESAAGSLFLEEEAEIRRYILMFEHLRAAALRPDESVTPGAMRPPSRSGVRRPLRRAPLPPEMLDDLVGLFVADLDQFVGKVAVLPLHDDRREFPTEVVPQGLISKAPVCLQPPGKSTGVVDGVAAADDRVEGDLVWHLEPFLPIVMDVRCAVGDTDR
jgi:Domain of unknown function (DUF5753)